MEIEFYYFDVCPSYKPAYKNLEEVLKEKGIEAKIKSIRVDSSDAAEKLNFQGSPSIRIDGKDIEDKDEGYSYSCRIFEIDGKLTGVPTREYLSEKIKILTGK
jgi:hypothetical protein